MVGAYMTGASRHCDHVKTWNRKQQTFTELKVTTTVDIYYKHGTCEETSRASSLIHSSLAYHSINHTVAKVFFELSVYALLDVLHPQGSSSYGQLHTCRFSNRRGHKAHQIHQQLLSSGSLPGNEGFLLFRQIP